MLYRKFELKKYRYFLKSIHGLWILPILIINFVVPLFNFFIYKLNNSDMEIDIEKIIFFFLPMFSVWTSIFVAELFFSDKTKDSFFFYGNKKRFLTTWLYFVVFLADTLVVVLLHFYCLNDFIGLSIKIFSVSLFYYGLAMYILYFSKSAAITVMILLLYDLTNTFLNGIHFFFFYENFDKLDFLTAMIQYFPLIIGAVLLIAIVFKGDKATTIK